MATAHRTTVGLVAMTCLLLLGLMGGCATNLPPAAADAVKAAFPQARIGEVELDKEDGLNLYEVELRGNGQETEVAVSPDGVIVEVESEVSMKDLPKAVADAIAKAAAGAKIEKIEREETRAVVRAGKLVKLDQPEVTYEAEFRKDGKEIEIEVAPDGTILKTEDEDDDEDGNDD